MAGHPILAKGVAGATSMADMGVVRGWKNHPHGLWGGPATLKKPKEKKKLGLLFGVARPPSKAMGWFGHPIPAVGGRDNGFEPLCDFFAGFVEVGFGDA